MIVVRVELWSAITGEKTELARMHISNAGGGTARRADYNGQTMIGRSSEALNRGRVHRSGEVKNHARLDRHVWNLVSKMLSNMGYGP